MSIIYNINIEPAKKHNLFHITWHKPETNTVDSFEQSIEITLDETHLLCHQQRHQLSIGHKLYKFLDSDNHHFQHALDRANRLGEPLQLNLCTCKQTADWPFELLAKDNTFLLPQELHLVRTVFHRDKEENIPPENRPLKLLFMACSAMDVKPELDFEQEEEAIFHITKNLPIHMEVEDSGSLEGLRRQLKKELYDVIHLSGHANIDKNGRPYFVMEDETGYHHNVFPDELWNEALIENPPGLLFLSGCRTGQTPDRSIITGAPENMAEGSFARLLVEDGKMPAVLGWGRSVNDKEATHAGRMLYRELSRGRSILKAVQRTRFELKKEFPHSDKPAWPLLRLYSSVMLLNAVVEENQRRKPMERRMRYVYLENSRVRVLAEGFVGRRRQLQTGLRALKQEADKVGLVLLGTAGLGKSCLAGKLCERFTQHTLIIIHGKFNTISLEAALTDAFVKAQDEKGQQLLTQKMTMTDKLIILCNNSFKEKNYLLLLDDFEQNLEAADKGQPGPLQPEAANLLNLLLRLLPLSGKKTQLIITSRYEFSLAEQDRNLVDERLYKIWLTSFRESEQLKKVQGLENIFYYPDQSLAPRLLAEACGNPRLMEWLNLLVGQMEAAEVAQLLEAIKDKQEEFINNHVLRELIQQGGDELVLFLRWLSIYRRPVPEAGVERVAEKAGLSGWRKLLQPGMSISLVEYDQVRYSYQVVPLLREELLNGLDEHKACHEAAFAFYKEVCEGKDWINPVLTEEWIFHALGCGEEDVASEQGGNLVNYLRDHLAYRESRRVGEWILREKKQKLSTKDDAFLLNSLAYTIHELGEYRETITHLELALAISRKEYGEGHPGVATTLNNLGEAWKALGQPEKTIDFYQQALAIYRAALGEEHSAVALPLNNLGEAWRVLGQPKKAIDFYQEALSIDRKAYGEMHPDVSRDLNNLGLAWYDLGEHQKAVDYYMEAYLIDRKLYGEEHPNIANTLINLGTVRISLSEYEKAIDYHQQALTIFKSVYGEKHPRMATILNNLGASWRALEEHHQAIAYFQQALSIARAVYGEENPVCALVLNNLGSSWNSSGEHKKAIDYYQQALTIWKKVYSENHPDVATTLNNLGSAWDALKEHHKAIEYFHQALKIYRAVYGEEHTRMASTLNNLGNAWKALGEPEKAIDYAQKALSIWKNVYGETHPNVSKALNNLGLAWEDLGEHKKAIDHYQQALNIELAVHGKEHPGIISCLNNLGSAWLALKDYKKAIDYCTRALSIYPMVKGEEHGKLSVTLTILAGAYNAQGLYRQAIPYYEQILEVLQKNYGEKHPKLTGTLNDLGLAWKAMGEYQKAINYHQQALSIYKKEYGEEHPDVANTLNFLGVAWKYLGEYQKAIDYYLQALKIYRKEYGDEHPFVVRELNNLGEAWRNSGQPEKAIDYFNQVLTIRKKTHTEKQPTTAATLNNLGSAWIDLGEFEKAIDYYLQALSIAKAAYGEEHPHVATTLNNLGTVYLEWGKKEQAKKYLEQAYKIYNKFFGPEHPFTQNTMGWLKACQ